MLPPEVTAEKLDSAMVAAQARLAPADAKAFAVVLDRLLDFAAAFGIPEPNTEAAARHYRDALRDLPPDLLEQAIAGVIRDWKWGHKMPLPADIRAQVSEELARRRTAVSRLRTATWKLGREDRSLAKEAAE